MTLKSMQKAKCSAATKRTDFILSRKYGSKSLRSCHKVVHVWAAGELTDRLDRNTEAAYLMHIRKVLGALFKICDYSALNLTFLNTGSCFPQLPEAKNTRRCSYRTERNNRLYGTVFFIPIWMPL